MELQTIIEQAIAENPVLEIEDPDYELLPQPENTQEQEPQDMNEALENMLQLAAAGADPDDRRLSDRGDSAFLYQLTGHHNLHST